MMALGIRLTHAGAGHMGAWVNGLLVEATWHGSRVRLTVRDADSSIVVTRTSATLDGASDRVRETIVRDLPRWSALLFGERHATVRD